MFNVESEAELEVLLAERAELAGKRARIALRVNPDVFAETHPYISTGLREHKFGIAMSGWRGRSTVRRRSCPWLDAAGVSVHIGSQIRAVEPFQAALARVLALVEGVKAKMGWTFALSTRAAGFGSSMAAGSSIRKPR